ncbi:MAG TPA: hypothetical protein ENK86_04950 [Campylobacterales bacterium]|nr:hypothetical protein [Campylobacterales bacterium]
MKREVFFLSLLLGLLVLAYWGVQYYVNRWNSGLERTLQETKRTDVHFEKKEHLQHDLNASSSEQGVEVPSNALRYPPTVVMRGVPTNTSTKRPALMASSIDQAFGTQITRITDKATQKVRQFLVAKTQFWNSDASKIRIDYKVYTTDTHAYVGELDSLLHEMKWSHRDPNILYGMHHNYRKPRLSRVNPDNAFVFFQIDVAHGFAMKPIVSFSKAKYSEVHIGPWEGNIDYNDRYVVFAAKKRASSTLVAIVYDIQKRQQVALKEFNTIVWNSDRKINQHDWISVSPHGNYILHAKRDVSSDYSWASYYIDLYDIHLKPLRRLSDTSEHGDICVTEAQEEVYVQYRGSNRERGIWSFNLAKGTSQPILQQGNETYGGGHISCRNHQRPGWCYVSSKGKRFKEVFALKLDGSGAVQRFGQTHGSETKVESSKGTPSPDGTQVLFQSTWGVPNRSEAYIAEAGDRP